MLKICKCGPHRGKQDVESIPSRLMRLLYSGAIGLSGLVTAKGA